jgi:hypothetical protein
MSEFEPISPLLIGSLCAGKMFSAAFGFMARLPLDLQKMLLLYHDYDDIRYWTAIIDRELDARFWAEKVVGEGLGSHEEVMTSSIQPVRDRYLYIASRMQIVHEGSERFLGLEVCLYLAVMMRSHRTRPIHVDRSERLVEYFLSCRRNARGCEEIVEALALGYGQIGDALRFLYWYDRCDYEGRWDVLSRMLSAEYRVVGFDRMWSNEKVRALLLEQGPGIEFWLG